jgi:hypothetical protein
MRCSVLEHDRGHTYQPLTMHTATLSIVSPIWAALVGLVLLHRRPTNFYDESYSAESPEPTKAL